MIHDAGGERSEATLRLGMTAMAGFVLLHAAALPLAVPYDGHEYIDFADVLFFARFPEDWNPLIRTPGYPLVLKSAFGLLGKQPNAITAANAAFAATFVSPTTSGRNVIHAGLPRLDAMTRTGSTRVAAGGMLSRFLWSISPLYDHVLVASGFLAMVAVGVLGAYQRDPRLLVITGVPLGYLLGHACMLASEDCYAFPAQPIALACLATVLVRSARVFRRQICKPPIGRTDCDSTMSEPA